MTHLRTKIILAAGCFLWEGLAATMAGGPFLDIGGRKQLFLDDHVVESMKNAAVVLNHPKKAENNPVIKRDRPWEGNELHYACVFWDDKESQFRMWYTSSTFSATIRNNTSNPLLKEKGVPMDTSPIICYAVSKDGFNWEKPSLGLVDYKGSKDNNILGPDNWRGFKGGIFINPKAKNPAQRYAALAQRAKPGSGERPNTVFIWELFYSADAFNWTPYEGNPVIDLPKHLWGPTSFMWDPVKEIFVGYMENCINKHVFFGGMCPINKRMVGRTESSDLIHWSEPSTVLVPDEKDPPDMQFYSMWAARYEDYYIGMLWNLRTTDMTLAPQFVFSRDGHRFDRRFRGPFIPLSADPQFDSVAIYSLQPIVHDDQVFYFYQGVNWRAAETLDKIFEKHGEDGAKGLMGLAVSPLDGFVSVDSGGHEFAEVMTRTFVFTGKQLRLNLRAAPQGWGGSPAEVRVELLDPDHSPKEGFTFQDADPLVKVGPATIVSWKGRTDLSEFAGKPVRLKISMKNAKLFSFQFVP